VGITLLCGVPSEPTMAATSSQQDCNPDQVQVNVLAKDEDGLEFRWSKQFLLQQPLLTLRTQWADAHRLPAAVVGFEDFREKEVDLERTPAELGWDSNNIVQLQAIPVDTKFAAKTAVPVPGKTNVPTSVGTKKMLASMKVDASNGLASAQTDTVVPSTAPVPSAAPTIPRQVPKRARKKAPEGAGIREATSDGAAGEPRLSMESSQLSQCSSVAVSSGSEDEELIVFESVNPKNEGSASYDRYEKYKVAKTRTQAMELGASREDIRYDYKKGFFKKA